MPKASSQKLKILYVMEYLLRNSDEEHPVSIKCFGGSYEN